LCKGFTLGDQWTTIALLDKLIYGKGRGAFMSKGKKLYFDELTQSEQISFLKSELERVNDKFSHLNKKFDAEGKAKPLFTKWLASNLEAVTLLKRINHSLTTRLAVFSEIRYITEKSERFPVIMRGYAIAADFDDYWWDSRDSLLLGEWADLLFEIGQEPSFFAACMKFKGREEDKYVISTDDEIEPEESV
jgi:hypothetical protein